MMRVVKLVVQVKPLPDEATETALRETLRLCNGELRTRRLQAADQSAGHADPVP